MKRQLQLFAFLFLATFFAGTTLQAQTDLNSADNFVVYPFGTSFDFNSKFAAIGESGGVAGPTADGCDLYGFRAQANPSEAINMGMLKFRIFNTDIFLPSLSFESNASFIISEQNASGGGGGSNLGCGKILAFYKDATSGSMSNNVYTIFGSGTASGGMWEPSDPKLKRDIRPIGDAINMVKQLNGVTYEFRTDEYPDLNLGNGQQYGFLTEEVKAVMPNAVRPFVDQLGQQTGFDVMRYNAIMPLLTEAVKEQQIIIEDQQLMIYDLEDRYAEQQKINEALEDRLVRLERLLNAQATTSSEAVNISAVAGVSLRQNRPNPFDGTTIIAYTIPSEMTSASLVVYDLNGKALSQLPLEAGDGQIKINAGELSSGVYFYAIENNGETLARQKMVVK